MKIILKNITKTFPSRSRRVHTPVTAVDHFSFEIPDGQLIGLLAHFRLRQKHYPEYDLRTGNTYRRTDFFRRSGCDQPAS